jgi:UDP-N-acetylglucosamine 2-epimerase (non-hydrolysing)
MKIPLDDLRAPGFESIGSGRPRTVMVVFGTRPEAIKLAPVVAALQCHPDLHPVVVVTGQHREMVDQVLDVFSIRPDHDLAIGRERQTLSGITIRVLAGLEPLLSARRPDAVLVQGDTATTMAGALAAFYQRVPVAHLEAGLRTGDRYAPFPEEINRRLTTGLASLHLAPTPASKANLLAEGVDPLSAICTGNTVIDALHHALRRGGAPLGDRGVPGRVGFEGLTEAGGRRIVLVTVHRRESWGAPMAGIGRALARLATDDPGLLIVIPLHPNPVVREALLPAIEKVDNVRVIEPLPYLAFARLLQAADLVLTDSGGIQEEGPSLGKPVLVLRDATERPEAVAAGTAELVGTDPEVIVARARRLLYDPVAYQRMAQATNPYGDGRATERTVAALSWALQGTARPTEFDPTEALPSTPPE